jgi:PKHD-type hydroxylase
MLIYPLAPSADLAGEECSHAHRAAVFTPAEVARILAFLDDSRWQSAAVGQPGAVDRSYRSAAIQWIQPAQLPWVFERLAQVVSEVNGRWFGFDLAGFCDPLQVSRYDGAAGAFDWHTDRGSFVNGRAPRKLTAIVQLTQPTAYQGGALEILTGRDPQRLDAALGSVHVFPAYVLHRVAPVTAGVRHSLVGWVCGPRFR